MVPRYLEEIVLEPLPRGECGPVIRTEDVGIALVMAEVSEVRKRVADVARGTRLPSGGDLRLLRVSRHVTTTNLARAAGWARQRVSTIEAQSRPTERSIRKYLSALEAITGAATDP